MWVQAGGEGKYRDRNWQEFMRDSADRNDALRRKPKYLHQLSSLEVRAVLAPAVTLHATATGPSVHLMLVEFDKAGNVTSPHSAGVPLRGQISTLGSRLPVHLSAGPLASDPQYKIGDWFQGFGDSSTGWAPTYCSFDETPAASSDGPKYYKYNPKFKPEPLSETFGCREWAYQLYDDARPYIDVTSYVPRTKQYPHGAYIRNYIGWARFDDRKPVIGKNGADWICLHDCPDGEGPGVIADIKAWAAKHGWAAPRPPKHMPMFPDPKPNKTNALGEE